MGQLLTLIIRIICGEKVEKSSEGEYAQLWMLGIFSAIFSTLFYFGKLNSFDLPETIWGVMLAIFILGIGILIFAFLIIILIPKKILVFILIKRINVNNNNYCQKYKMNLSFII
jgi:hypothetical protein